MLAAGDLSEFHGEWLIQDPNLNVGLFRMFRSWLLWGCWTCPRAGLWSHKCCGLKKRAQMQSSWHSCTLFTVTLTCPKVLEVLENQKWKKILPHFVNVKTETKRKESAVMAAPRLEIWFYFSEISVSPLITVLLVLGYILLVEIFFFNSFFFFSSKVGNCMAHVEGTSS